MSTSAANNLDAFWMPFTANRQFKSNPRMLVSAKDMHYMNAEGRKFWMGPRGFGVVTQVTAAKKL
nr:hypothetical protein [Sneathiella glossodoripedis]